jgi:hypothetical protein
MTKQSIEEAEEQKAYYLFAAIGVGYLFPFSALTQPVDYWYAYPTHNIPSVYPLYTLSIPYLYLTLSIV